MWDSLRGNSRFLVILILSKLKLLIQVFWEADTKRGVSLWHEWVYSEKHRGRVSLKGRNRQQEPSTGDAHRTPMEGAVGRKRTEQKEPQATVKFWVLARLVGSFKQKFPFSEIPYCMGAGLALLYLLCLVIIWVRKEEGLGWRAWLQCERCYESKGTAAGGHQKAMLLASGSLEGRSEQGTSMSAPVTYCLAKWTLS